MFAVERGDGGIRVVMSAEVADALRELNRDYRSLLEAAPAGDPVVERLYPDAYDDPRFQQSYSELVGSELERGKNDTAEAIADTLQDEGAVDVTLPAEDVELWLRWLTDVRLMIGTRIGITEDRLWPEPDPADPDADAIAVMEDLAWLQQCLLDQLMPTRGSDATQ